MDDYCYFEDIRQELAEQERQAIAANLLKALELATETPASVVRVVGTFKLLVVLAAIMPTE